MLRVRELCPARASLCGVDAPAGDCHPLPGQGDLHRPRHCPPGVCQLWQKLGAETEYLVSRDFLSGQEDKELLLLRFLHLAFALGPGTVKREGHPVVAPLYAMKKSLDWEVDKFQGFVRFEEHDGMLGAVIHPKNYILPLLRPHFCGRFPEEDFMIYDAVHQAVLLHEKHGTRLLELAAPLELPPPSAREQQFQALWTQFYKTLEIKARHNEKGRMTHCPKRFWADMVEMRSEL